MNQLITVRERVILLTKEVWPRVGVEVILLLGTYHRLKAQQKKVPYPGLIISGITFHTPFLRCNDLIVLAVLRLLIKYAYTTESDYGKFTISYVMSTPTGEVSFTISNAIPFREDGQDLPYPYTLIDQLVRQKAEDYDGAEISSIYIRIYLSELKSSAMPYISDDDIASKIWESFNNKETFKPREARKIGHSKRCYPKHITALKASSSQRQPFIVADIETLLINDVHVPYAVGFMVVRPGDYLSSETDYGILIYFSEDYPDIVFSSFEERSNKLLFDFIERIVVVVKKDPSIKVVYFHNFSRFDGIILMKFIATHGVKYTFTPLMRNNRLYELSVYHGKKLLFRLRDSLTLLPSSLDNLAKNLCPHLGVKGSIPHENVQVSNLSQLRDQLISYLKQDIRLLGGVMLKAQSIYFDEFKVDIVTKLTLSSLALCIYRTNFYDPNTFPIHIPNRNEDSFLRRAYYGGHADTYQPKGENLDYYDVNSLYPYIMKTFPMPGGKPVWHGKLEGQDIDRLYGYFEAHIVCPPTIKKPFLAYRDNLSKTIVFPTGEFVGVYFSEELKYARDIGYQVTLISGYSFEKMNSPFESFVNTIYDKRKDAKRTGNDAMAYVYKILMNSLYGRFGINPKCTITEVCDLDRYNLLTKISDYIFADKLSEHYYIVTYWSNTGQVSDSDWCPPRISAVQLAAAVTACARIHMYPYISRPDSYYTDTDSVVLGSPLPEEDVSSTELGKFKLEYYALEERMEDTLNRTSTQYLVESKAPAQAVQSKKEMSAFVLAQAKAQSANSSRKSSSGDPVTDRKKS
ncbi:DNA polymerase-like [Prosopis cineraria]|uniref:DNA polymerase-like n=2 Tax=Prosopis cineraria TaxID=364024 RepID=UPI002410040B|nr:DNA polymerase-like [Prosopis cineraria]